MDSEFIRNRGVNLAEELFELLRPMFWVAFTEYRSCRHVKGRKQVRRSMPNVIVRTTLRLPQAWIPCRFPADSRRAPSRLSIGTRRLTGRSPQTQRFRSSSRRVHSSPLSTVSTPHKLRELDTCVLTDFVGATRSANSVAASTGRLCFLRTTGRWSFRPEQPRSRHLPYGAEFPSAAGGSRPPGSYTTVRNRQWSSVASKEFPGVGRGPSCRVCR